MPMQEEDVEELDVSRAESEPLVASASPRRPSPSPGPSDSPSDSPRRPSPSDRTGSSPSGGLRGVAGVGLVGAGDEPVARPFSPAETSASGEPAGPPASPPHDGSDSEGSFGDELGVCRRREGGGC